MTRQNRLVTLEQLTTIGLTRHQIEHRIATVRLVPRYRGVYVVGPGPLTAEGEWLAATLFAGPGSAVSHYPAAARWELKAWRPGAIIDITAPRRIAAPKGLRAHRSELPFDERTIRGGVPITTTGRTILDCAAQMTVRETERLINEARVLRLPIRPSLATLISRHPHRRGVATARAALAAFAAGRTHTRSELEERFLAFLDRHGFPRPRTNQDVRTHLGTLNVDCLWPAERLIIELDGYSTHGSRPAFTRDRRRDRALRIAGWHPSRLTWEDLDDGPALAAEISALLAA